MELDTSSKKIKASINYAKRIQEALLPNLMKVREVLPESFVLFKPRDVVSGDFFWFSVQNGKVFIAALDCTGHGVPGAFMSMIGNELLNEAIIRMKIDRPEEILYHIHKGVRRDLRQYETDNRDGMDMSIVVIDQEAQELVYAGAKSPLIYIQDGEMQMFKGDAFPVGGEQRERRRVFTAHTIKIDKPTVFYQFSDGYQDQFGGPEGRKFMNRRLRELLFERYSKPALDQKEILEGVLKRWMGNVRQLDDILLIGAKVAPAPQAGPSSLVDCS